MSRFCSGERSMHRLASPCRSRLPCAPPVGAVGESPRPDRHNARLGFLLAVGTRDRLQDRLRDSAVEPEEFVIPKARAAVEQAGVVRLPADQRVLPVVVAEYVGM